MASFLLLQVGGTDNLLLQVGDDLLLQADGAAAFQSAWAIGSNSVVWGMKKNVAGQVVGAQLVSATDGSNFTGAVTCYVTGNAGTQAVGSVGAGACAHEGNGYHSYAPAQAETNYDQVAFTFTGTGAVTVTKEIYTAFPQTGDNFALIGATGSGLTSLAPAATALSTAQWTGTRAGYLDNLSAGAVAQQATLLTVAGYIDTEIASLISSLATVSSNVDAILVDTGTDIPALIDAVPTVSELNARTLLAADYATAANLATVAGYIDTEIGTIITTLSAMAGATFDTATDSLEAIRNRGDAAWVTATGFSTLSQADVRTAVGLATNNLDTQLTDLPTVAEFNARTLATADYATAAALATATAYIDTEVAAIKASTDNLPSDPADASVIAAAFATVNATLATINALLDTEIAAILEDTGTTLPAQIAALNNLSASQVKTQVVDALSVDTYGELVAVPTATSTLVQKINWLFALARNKITQTATTQALRNDADSANIATSTVSDDLTTTIRGEFT